MSKLASVRNFGINSASDWYNSSLTECSDTFSVLKWYNHSAPAYLSKFKQVTAPWFLHLIN